LNHKRYGFRLSKDQDQNKNLA